MEIIRTFDEQYQGIYLARFVDCPFYITPLDYETELSKSLDLLQDPLYVRQAIKSSDSGWRKGELKHTPLSQLVSEVLEEIGDLTEFIYEIRQESQSDSLDWLLDNFKPLSSADVLHKPERLKLYTYDYGSLLRLYGVQLGKDAVIITGIAIKLVHYMKDSKTLQEELDKMNHLRSWLVDHQITHCEQLDI